MQANAAHQEHAALTAKQYSAAMRNLPAQITDIVTGLASGQPAYMVAIQQGGQLKDMFGGIGGAAKALASVITPTSVAIGAVGLAAGAAAMAFLEGRDDSKRLADALALSGNQAAVTEGQVNGLVLKIAALQNVSTGAVRSAIESVVASGTVGQAAFEPTTRAIVALSKASGQSAQEVAAAFRTIGEDSTEWFAKMNRGIHFLTAEQYNEIVALQEQGHAQEAVRKGMEALAGTLESRLHTSLGGLETMLKKGKDLWDQFWNAAKGLGRPETAEERLKRLKAALAEATPNPNAGPLEKLWNWGGVFDDGSEQRRRQATLQREIDLAENSAGLEASALAARSALQAKADEAALRASRANVDAQLAIEQAAFAAGAAQHKVALDARKIQIERAYDLYQIDAKEYSKEIIAIERQRIADEEKLAAEAVAVEERRVAKTTLEREQRDAAVAAARARLAQASAQRQVLQAKIDARAFDPKPRESREDAQDAFMRAERASANAGFDAGAIPGLRWLGAQRDAGREQAKALEEQNRRLNAELIRDDRERGQALIVLEEQELKQRLNLQYLGIDERKRAEDELAQWRVLRERQLSEQLKPEWQRQVESWSDATHLMRDVFNDTITASLREGEQAWVRFTTTGSLSIHSLGRAIEEEVARYAYRKFVSLMFKLLPSTFGSFGFGTGLGYGSQDYALFLHGGGVVGVDRAARAANVNPADWASAPRLHQGLGFDEFRAVLKRGESVLTPGQMAQLGPAGGASLTVNVINQTGTPMQATQQRGANGSYEVILTAAEEYMADRLASGTGALSRAGENRYGWRPKLS